MSHPLPRIKTRQNQFEPFPLRIERGAGVLVVSNGRAAANISSQLCVLDVLVGVHAYYSYRR
jgi:hypothetical protein